MSKGIVKIVNIHHQLGVIPTYLMASNRHGSPIVRAAEEHRAAAQASNDKDQRQSVDLDEIFNTIWGLESA